MEQAGGVRQQQESTLWGYSIYVALDSGRLGSPELLFQLDNNVPKAVAGCPPDGFPRRGSSGNPLFAEWDYTGGKKRYEWWIKRLSYCCCTGCTMWCASFISGDLTSISTYRRGGKCGERTRTGSRGPGIKFVPQGEEALGKGDYRGGSGVCDDGLGAAAWWQERQDIGYEKVLEFAFDSEIPGA